MARGKFNIQKNRKIPNQLPSNKWIETAENTEFVKVSAGISMV